MVGRANRKRRAKTHVGPVARRALTAAMEDIARQAGADIIGFGDVREALPADFHHLPVGVSLGVVHPAVRSLHLLPGGPPAIELERALCDHRDRHAQVLLGDDPAPAGRLSAGPGVPLLLLSARGGPHGFTLHRTPGAALLAQGRRHVCRTGVGGQTRVAESPRVWATRDLGHAGDECASRIPACRQSRARVVIAAFACPPAPPERSPVGHGGAMMAW